MKTILPLLVLTVVRLSAQVEIHLNEVASQIGDEYRMFANQTDIQVGERIGDPGGPQEWDFRDGPSELIHDYRIIAASETGFAGDYPSATYVEEVNRKTENTIGWSYYRNRDGVGREYFGGYDEAVTAGSKQIKFQKATNDLPELMKFGTKWDRVVNFPSEIDALGLPVSVEISFDSRAHVDAWGTMLLPEIGKVEVLRVNELNRWDTIADLFGNKTTLDSFYVRNYYWYAKGVGLVALLKSSGLKEPPVQNFYEAAHFFRLFETSKEIPEITEPMGVEPEPAPRVGGANPVSSLTIEPSPGFVVLEWAPATQVDHYRVLARDQVDEGDWRELASLNSTLFADPMASGKQRFYQVIAVGGGVE